MLKLKESEKRKNQILISLDELEFLTTSQIWQLHKLKSRRNTSRIMNEMLKPYVNTFMDEEKVYYLNSAGRSIIQSDRKVTKTMHSKHKLIRNQFYISFRPKEWKTEYPIRYTYEGTEKLIIPDAIYKKGSFFQLLEVDHTQPMEKNRQKIDRYAEFRDTMKFQERHNHFPALVWVTTSGYRRDLLTEYGHEKNFNNIEVYTIDDLR